MGDPRCRQDRDLFRIHLMDCRWKRTAAVTTPWPFTFDQWHSGGLESTSIFKVASTDQSPSGTSSLLIGRKASAHCQSLDIDLVIVITIQSIPKVLIHSIHSMTAAKYPSGILSGSFWDLLGDALGIRGGLDPLDDCNAAEFKTTKTKTKKNKRISEWRPIRTGHRQMPRPPIKSKLMNQTSFVFRFHSGFFHFLFLFFSFPVCLKANS